jgi:lipopolysaccharide transport system ATP-binding protein
VKQAVRVEGVYKEFPFYQTITAGGVKSFLLHMPKAISSLKKTRFVALRDLTFDAFHGETVGIVGENGSGKSTILGLIAGVLKPDRGTISIDGKVSSLLELGAGFHPDLSGEENIVLNGILLGLTRREVIRKIEEIKEFSGLGDFITQPLRTYSSGMCARLGFSVAVHVEHQILLVDEVMAVGDAEFQEKCLDKMEEIKRSGVTIVIVSHDLSLITSICDRAIWIDEGRARSIGEPEAVVKDYLGHTGRSIGLSAQEPAASPETTEDEGPEESVSGEQQKAPSWWDSPMILGHIEGLITGDRGITFYRFLRREYVREPLERGFCLRSRLPAMVDKFVESGICKGFEVIEISPDYGNEDDRVDKISPPSRTNFYDLFVSVDALGRVSDLRGFLAGVRNSLKEEGLVIALEYIGTGEVMRTREQEEILNMFYRLIPDSFKTGETLSRLAERPYRTGSSLIVPSLGEFFDIDAIKYLGGSLYGPLFSNISTGFDVLEKEASSLMKVILEFEQVLIEKGILPNDYAMVIGRKRTGA